MLTFGEGLQIAKQELNASLDAELLLMHVANISRSHLYAWPEKNLTSQQEKQFLDFIARAKQGEPVAYLLNQKEFWSLPLEVTTDTLIPRPETELLVEIILKNFSKEINLSLLDLGTGSGAIALALAHEKPNWKIFATDVSKNALSVAKRNAQRLQISNINFQVSDWFAKLNPEIKFDVVVSNPPYISEEDNACEYSVKKFEPHLALFAKEKGLADLRKIIQEAKFFLKPQGCLLVEHGYNQAEAVNQLFVLNGYENIHLYSDLSDHDRATQGFLPKLIAPV